MGGLRPVGPARGATTAELIQAAFADEVTRLRSNEAGVRAGRDPEAVHQARVAARRLRSHLRTFAVAIRPKTAEALAGELRWLGQLLGAVRDLDVLTERLSASELEAAQLAAVLDRAAIDRQLAFAAACLGLASDRYRSLTEHLAVVVATPPVRPAVADLPAIEVMMPQAERAWHRFESEVAGLPAAPADAQLHQVRIRSKQARYATEVVAPLRDTDRDTSLADVAKSFARVQKTLGDFNDAVHAAHWLEGLLTAEWAEVDEDPFIAVELLLSREHLAMAKAREAWRARALQATEAVAAARRSGGTGRPPGHQVISSIR
jgi:CHAD domain-containing protein